MNYFSQRVIDQWNAFPESIVTAPYLNAFKSRLNKFLKDHPFKFSLRAIWPTMPDWKNNVEMHS